MINFCLLVFSIVSGAVSGKHVEGYGRKSTGIFSLVFTILYYSSQWPLCLTGISTPLMLNPFSRSHTHCSMFQWPTQPLPSAAARKRWHDILSVLYFQPQTYNLSKPLGAWLDTHSQDYIWEWHACLQTWTIFHYRKGQWQAHSPYQWNPTYILYHQWSSPTPAPSNTVPTPELPNFHHMTNQTSSILIPKLVQATLTFASMAK